MDDKLKKLMEAHMGKEPMDPRKKEAKMSMLKELQSQMKGLIGEGLDRSGMKKVEVAADDKEGLLHGLEKAQDLVEGSDELGDFEEDVDGEEELPEHESAEMPAEEEAEHSEELSDEERALLEKLLAKARR